MTRRRFTSRFKKDVFIEVFKDRLTTNELGAIENGDLLVCD